MNCPKKGQFKCLRSFLLKQPFTPSKVIFITIHVYGYTHTNIDMTICIPIQLLQPSSRYQKLAGQLIQVAQGITCHKICQGKLYLPLEICLPGHAARTYTTSMLLSGVNEHNWVPFSSPGSVLTSQVTMRMNALCML